METKGKESVPVKEKRGTSPSFPGHTDTTQRRRSLNPGALATSPDQHKRVTTLSESTKPVPNYLKPTISSGLDPSKHQSIKKPSSTGSTQVLQGKAKSSCNTAQNPALTRRRSFDKPPSPSQVQKPGTLQSSSFKLTNFPKPHPERPLKTPTPKDAGTKSQSVYSRSVNAKKTSAIIPKQHNAGNALKRKAPKPEVEVEVEPCQDDQESSVTEVEEENVNEMPADILAPEDKDHVDDTLHVETEKEETEIKLCESTMVSEDKRATPAVEMEETRSILKESEDHSNGSLTGKIDQNESKVVDNLSKEEGEGTATEDNGEEKALDEKEEGDEGSKVVKPNEKSEEVEGDTENNSAAKPQGGVQVNKKDSAAYNDVIEETATKLREQRKNKVKALVGAFETVISLQEPEP